jgi:hypothetical protein
MKKSKFTEEQIADADVRQNRIGLIAASRGCSRCDAKRGS